MSGITMNLVAVMGLRFEEEDKSMNIACRIGLGVCLLAAFSAELDAQCELCNGAVSSLTLEYQGGAAAQVEVLQRDDLASVFSSNLTPSQQFSMTGSIAGTFGTAIDIYVDGSYQVSVKTDCSPPLYANTTHGDFLVVAGVSTIGGALCPVPSCPSSDTTNIANCFRDDFSDAQILELINGTGTQPLSPPVICGTTVSDVATARTILDESDCVGFQRESLTLTFNIRQSILYGDGLFGTMGAICPLLDHPTANPGSLEFDRVLECGSVRILDTSTPDPDDVVVLTENTPMDELLSFGHELCIEAACPPDTSAPCGSTLFRIGRTMRLINESRSRFGDCSSCAGDVTPPTLTCPTSPVQVECTSPTGAQVSYSVTASDDCATGLLPHCFPPSGVILNVGTHPVACSVEDYMGNLATCTFDIEVTDSVPPTITCPTGPITISCADPAGEIVNYPAPSVFDLCDTNPNVICVPPSGSLFLPGTTTVTCTATDASGNSASCEFDVVIEGDTPPSITCPGDVIVACEGPDGAIVNYPDPLLSDGCEPPTNPSCTPPSGSLFPIGVTTVTCTADTTDGGTVTCEFDITVQDIVPPVIQGPAGLTTECTSPDGAAVSFSVTATDDCDPSPQVTCVPESGSTFPLGSTLVACSATDASGNNASFFFTVVVEDTTPPAIVCPGDLTVDCTSGGEPNGAVVNYSEPTATDLCDAAPAVTCDPAPGSFFPLGTTTVTCTAVDADGNESTCTFDLTVVDATPPALTCPEDFSVECAGPEGAVVDYPLPGASDACESPPTVTCTPPSGSLLPIGDTLITCTSTDAAGNSTECSFMVSVVDTTPPVISCPADLQVECESPAGTSVLFTTSAIDLCDPDPTVVCDPPSGSVFAPGTNTVFCSATDADGNVSNCEFTIFVVDQTPPSITCPEPVVAECTSPDGAVVTFANATATDECDPNVSVISEPPSGALFPLGVTLVTCTATDSSGNTSTCSFDVSVVDTTPPSISCSQDAVILECESGTATIQYPAPTVADVCDAEPTVICTPPEGSVLPLGTHTVTCVATDSAGNSAECMFEVQVVDSGPPSLVCPADIVRECDGPDGAVVDYSLPTPSDTCDPAPSLICLPPPGSLFPIGSTTVTCSAEDSSGNMVECSFVVTIEDTTPPALDCPADMTVECSSPDGATVSLTATATDLCDPTPIITFEPASGTLFPMGETVVRCTATDVAGNSSECEFTVTVVDQTPPQIACPADYETECLEDGFAVVEYPTITATDTCDPAPVVTCDPPSGSSLPAGENLISCTAADAAGNTVLCEFTVTVVDATAPELICPADLTVECTGPDGATVDLPDPVANDACDGQPLIEFEPASGTVFPMGEREVLCRSVDASGNETTCTFFVTVSDTTPPEIACPQVPVVECDDANGATVEFEATAIDVCDPAPSVSCDIPSGSVFPLGDTVVTCTAIDAEGNTSTCEFTVTVVDREAPVMTCPEDLQVICPFENANPPRTECDVIVEFSPPEATDNCDEEVQVVCTPASGSRFALGVHTITCRARDRSGNESTCTFDIEVLLEEGGFVRGDANDSGGFELSDAITILNWLFFGFAEPPCLDAADANDDSSVDLADAVFDLTFLFLGGVSPPAPWPLCAADPTPDAFDCASYTHCDVAGGGGNGG